MHVGWYSPFCKRKLLSVIKSGCWHWKCRHMDADGKFNKKKTTVAGKRGVKDMAKPSQMWLQISACRQNRDSYLSDAPSAARRSKTQPRIQKRKTDYSMHPRLLCRTPASRGTHALIPPHRFFRCLMLIACRFPFCQPSPSGVLSRPHPPVVWWTGFNYIQLQRSETAP